MFGNMKRKAVQPGNPQRAVSYSRVSTAEQGNGVEAQRAAIRAWAAREHIQVVAEFEDRVSGAAPADEREGLLAALAALREHAAGWLVAAKHDRFARDVVVAATIERLVQNAGAKIATADGVSVEDTPEGELQRTLLRAFAAYERAMIRSRTRASLRVLRTAGKRYTRLPPLGFRFESGLLVEDPAEMALLTRVRKMRASGLPYQGIADQLTAEGVKLRAGRWSVTLIRRICIPGVR